MAQDNWDNWPPYNYLLKSLVGAVPEYLQIYHPQTGRFGTEPWTCLDQNLIFPLAAAWAIEDENNPWYHDQKVLQAIAGGGEALLRAQDKDGKWTFRKKDGSTWGQIHQPWTYSRWVRAYYLVREALPEASRKKWEQGLLRGFNNIRPYMHRSAHNIPTHHAMALYIAGICFKNQEWKEAAQAFMAKVVGAQDPGGFWTQHFGPLVGYNRVFVEAVGIYYYFSRDPGVKKALERSAKFHSSILWPDGSSVSAIDERNIYQEQADVGNVGFSWTPEGRGFLLEQLQRYSKNGKRPVNADYAATILLYGGKGKGIPLEALRDGATTILGNNDALIRRQRPWQWVFSGYACKPVKDRWVQDRHNLVEVFHDQMGLVIGGGNTKLQPYWSTFTVGDPSLFQHKPGDESPDFTPEIDLLWTPDKATITTQGKTTRMTLTYGEVQCGVSVEVRDDGAMALTYQAPAKKRLEAHMPLMRRTANLHLATGKILKLSHEELLVNSDETGGWVVFGGLKMTVPRGALLRWPARHFNPYKKDGSSPIRLAKLVLVLPFNNKDEHTVILCHQPLD